MAELVWFELTPPREVDLAAVTALLRPLANRPRYGLPPVTPVVVFELWGQASQVRWRLGLDARLSRDVPRQMRAHLPRLGIVPLTAAARPALTLAASVRLAGLSSPLRLDTAASVADELLGVLTGLAAEQCAVVQWVLGPAEPRSAAPTRFDLAEALGVRATRPADSTAARLFRQKAAEPLLGCVGRIGAVAASPAQAYVVIRALASALKLANSEHAGLRLGRATRAQARRLITASRPLGFSCLLSVAELAALLGWPVQDDVGDELPTVGGHISPAPAKLLMPDEAPQRERVLGNSLHPTQRGELVKVPVATSLHHLHVVGPTGSGKSTLLCGLIQADMAAGRSILVVEPKGDLINDVLARVPEHRRDDVVVIDPGGGQWPVGFNPLAGPVSEAERRADQVVGLLHQLHGTNFGPRTQDVALHALIAVARLKDGTLPDVPILLTNPVFRRRVLAEVGDPLTLAPFFAWYDGISDAERGQVIAPLLNKLRPWTSRMSLRRMLGQARPRFSLGELFTKRRIVLVSLNRGALGPETSSLLGALLLTQLWAAIQRRSTVPAARRHPVMVVIDEVQGYLHVPGVDLGDLFAQARGLGVGLTVAHQHLDQLSSTQRAAILANARSRVVFRPATSDAKSLAASLGGSLTGEDLLRLKAYQASAQLLVDGQPCSPFSVITRPLPPWTAQPDELRRVSGERYGVDGDQLDQALTERWHGGGPGEGPVGFKRRSAS